MLIVSEDVGESEAYRTIPRILFAKICFVFRPCGLAAAATHRVARSLRGVVGSLVLNVVLGTKLLFSWRDFTTRLLIMPAWCPMLYNSLLLLLLDRLGVVLFAFFPNKVIL